MITSRETIATANWLAGSMEDTIIIIIIIMIITIIIIIV